jgi:hypothetical protein
MATWLLDRLFAAADQPVPRFAFQGSVNWMRVLAILADSPDFEHPALRAFHGRVSRRAANAAADTLAYETLLLALHNTASVEALSAATDHYENVRSGIVSWYYAIYNAAKAMIAAASGANPQTHSKTADVWQNDIAQHGLALVPFSYCLDDLRPKSVDAAIGTLRGKNPHHVNLTPTDATMAHGAVVSYLNGTADYGRWECEERVKQSGPYRALGVSNFKTAAARALRDAALSQEKVCFLTQAFRYRGKANYRDSIYLSYGADRSAEVTQLMADLALVAERFTRMACHYVAKRTERGTWGDFVADVAANSRFAVPVNLGHV